MDQEHYFSAAPATPAQYREINVTLAGNTLRLKTAAGVFSPGHVDKGTQVLLKYLPPPLGELLDLGCGWGALALSAALQMESGRVTAVDVNDRALELLKVNYERVSTQFPCAPIQVCRPEEVPDDLYFDTIWSNPPIRIGKEALHELLHAWLPRLKLGGHAYLVVQKNLGADSLMTHLQNWPTPANPYGVVQRLATSGGFRVLDFNLLRRD